MRVGIISLFHESNTFMPEPTGLEAFERTFLMGGASIRTKFRWEHHEITGCFDGLEAAGIEAVPIFIAWATPGGCITDEALQKILSRLLGELETAGRVDGILACPHGAAVSRSILDVDGHWLGLLRQRVGRGVPIIATIDPHANLSQQMVDASDALIAYRSNPHVDQYQRGREAAALMARTLRGEVRPTQAASFPPLAINIERQLTSEPPCAPMYRLADEMLTREKVLSNSVMLGFPYADVPEMGSGAIVVTDNDPALARGYADELGAYLWRHREDFVGQLISIADAIDRAERSSPPVCLLDMGDNVGGGSPGDGTLIARSLQDRGLGPAFVCLHDPQCVREAMAAGVGTRVSLRMGGKTDELHGPPLVANVTVRSFHDGRFVEPQVRHGAIREHDMGQTAIVQSERGLTVQLTSRRVFPVSLVQLTCCGMDPASFRVLEAKGVHAPLAAYSEICRSFIRVNSPGVTTADLTRLNYRHRRRPMFPFEYHADWPTDRPT